MSNTKQTNSLKNIVFVVGNSRSGTTMLGRMLGNHSSIQTFPELHFFCGLASYDELFNATGELSKDRCTEVLCQLYARNYLGFWSLDDAFRYEKKTDVLLKNKESMNLNSLYIDFLEKICNENSKSIACEQTPYYLSFVKEIDQNIDKANFINLIRDPRAVLLSQKNRWRRRFSTSDTNNVPWFSETLRSFANYSPITSSLVWRAGVRRGLSEKSRANFKIVKYEDLVSQPEITLKPVCSMLEIVFEEEMVNIPQIGSSSGKDNPDKLGEDSKKNDKWQEKGGLADHEIAIVQFLARNEMLEMGYEFKKTNVLKVILGGIYVLLIFIPKTILALSLNLKRSKNIFQLVARRFSNTNY